MTEAPGIGRLIAVVGPSGVGKDSIIAGAGDSRPCDDAGAPHDHPSGRAGR